MGSYEYNLMLGWLSRCWGGFGVNSQFERARLRSIITDWKVPEDGDLCILINSFKGENPEIAHETALQMFFTHMQLDEEKANPIFLLKHLYILDQTVEERTALDRIAAYYSSQFFTFKTGENIEITPIRELVATYFMYVKKKAEVYSQVEPALFEKKEGRREVIESMGNNDIFVLVQRCFDIQKAINEINTKYKGRNKSAELIQMIFAMLLKTYLFCYTTVSSCAKALYKRLNRLSKSQAVRMYKFIVFFNKDYTRNFVDFIESNKEVPIYRNIKYSEIILIDKAYVQFLENHIQNIGNQPAALLSEVVNQEDERILTLPEELLSSIQDIKIAYQPRKERAQPRARQFTDRQFYNYQNLYTTDYETEYETSIRNVYNAQQEAAGEKPMSESNLFRSKKIEMTASASTKFSETMWNEWSNVYSS